MCSIGQLIHSQTLHPVDEKDSRLVTVPVPTYIIPNSDEYKMTRKLAPPPYVPP